MRPLKPIERTIDVVKVMYLCRAKPGMTAEQMHAHHRDVHTPLGLRIPGMRGWRANYVDPQMTRDLGQPDSAYDMVIESWWDSLAAMQQAFATPEGQAAAADIPELVDMQTLRILVAEEKQLIPVANV